MSPGDVKVSENFGLGLEGSGLMQTVLPEIISVKLDRKWFQLGNPFLLTHS